MNDMAKALRCIASQWETGDCYMDKYNSEHREAILNGTEKGMRCGNFKDAIQCPYHQDTYGVCFEDGDFCQWMDKVADIVEEAERNKWISVRDELPQEGIEVEVTIKEIPDDYYTARAWMQDGQWVIKKNPLLPEVIAWRNVAEPYKEAVENECKTESEEV